MRLKNLKRALALALALTAVLALTPPASAVRFQDVQDQQTALAADVLSALGVVSGTGDGQFSPDGHLTRAQLCKMAIEILGMGNQAKSQAYRTIFSDMGSTHWARGYVNLAAITEIPEGSKSRLMLGLGNGQFGPDREVTYQEAVTLALRILGYSEEANRTWPHGALAAATRLGLDQDLEISNPAGPITRAQTALLFYRTLATPAMGSEEPFAARLGTLVENSVVLATDATINNQSGWVITAQGDASASYPAAAPVDQSLLGLRGWALLDKEGRFVTLLPNDSSYVTTTVERRQGSYLYLSGKGRFTMSDSTPVYTGSAYDATVTTYKDYSANLRPGDVVTLYLDEGGKVAGLYRSQGSTEEKFLMVRSSAPNVDYFLGLTDGVKDFTVHKNGRTIAVADIKPYDIVTYDPISKVLEVCDVRLTCIYENAAPTPSAPTKITAAGNEFNVMADAISEFNGRKIGDKITLMFTAGGMVAGVAPEGVKGVGGNALGVISGGEFELLNCNLRLKLPNGVPTDVSPGEILLASSQYRTSLEFKTAGITITARFDKVNMMLDHLQVSPYVRVFERTFDGTAYRLIEKSVAELPSNPAVVQYHKDESGRVDILILAAYSGDERVYGRIDTLNGYRLSGGLKQEGDKVTNIWTLQPVQGVVFTGADGSPVGYDDIKGLHPSGYGTIYQHNGSHSISYLNPIEKVPSTAFFDKDGKTFVRTNKGVFEVDDAVVCFNASASYESGDKAPDWVRWLQGQGGGYEGELPEWMPPVGTVWTPGMGKVTAFSSLNECRNFADEVTIYCDPVGNTVRVVEAK